MISLVLINLDTQIMTSTTIADLIDGIIPIFLGGVMYLLALKQKNNPNTDKLKKAAIVVIVVGVILFIVKLF